MPDTPMPPDNTRSLAAAEELLRKMLARHCTMFGHDEGCSWHGDLDCTCGGDDIRAYLALPAAAPDAGLREALDACETALSPVMADHTCAEFPNSDRRCDECLGCMNARVWAMAAAALQGDGNG